MARPEGMPRRTLAMPRMQRQADQNHFCCLQICNSAEAANRGVGRCSMMLAGGKSCLKST